MIAPDSPVPLGDDPADDFARGPWHLNSSCASTICMTAWQGRPLAVAVHGPGAPGARLGRRTCYRARGSVPPPADHDAADNRPCDTFDVLTLNCDLLPGIPEVRLLESRIASDAPEPSLPPAPPVEPGSILVVRTWGSDELLALRASFAKPGGRAPLREAPPPNPPPPHPAPPRDAPDEPPPIHGAKQ